MDWLLAVATLIANQLLIKYKSWWTFLLFLGINLAWTVWWASFHQWAMMALTMVFCLQNLWGAYQWGSKRALLRQAADRMAPDYREDKSV